MDGFCPLMKNKLDSGVLTYKSGIFEQYGQEKFRSILKKIGDEVPARILKLSKLYQIEMNETDKVVYDATDITYFVKIGKIIPGRLMLSYRLLIFIKLGKDEDIQAADTPVNFQTHATSIGMQS
jgi:hypothetical protein